MYENNVDEQFQHIFVSFFLLLSLSLFSFEMHDEMAVDSI